MTGPVVRVYGYSIVNSGTLAPFVVVGLVEDGGHDGSVL
jgi:hypothetical protein